MEVLGAMIAIAALLSRESVRRLVPTESGLAFVLVSAVMLVLLFSGKLG